jgi:hypothetical protein
MIAAAIASAAQAPALKLALIVDVLAERSWVGLSDYSETAQNGQ